MTDDTAIEPSNTITSDKTNPDKEADITLDKTLNEEDDQTEISPQLSNSVSESESGNVI